MSLSYNITDLLTISDANASVNALPAETVNADAYEMAFFGVANFLSGNYIQNSAAVDDIKSNITVSSAALNNAHFFYVSNVDSDNSESYPGGGESAYGANITQTGTIFGSAAVTDVADSNNAAITLTDIKTFGNEFIAMSSIAAGSGETVVNSTNKKLLAAQSSVGDGLLQAVSAALFKKLGKNAALLNDSSLVTDLNTKFHTALETEMIENNSSYGDSKYIKRYVESGRYQNDSADLNADVTYNMNNTVVNMVVSISGSVVDSDGGPDLSSNTTALSQIFGTSGTDHLIADNGVYTIKAFISLKHDERF
jgi:predicted HD phosphohydrolase